MNESSRPRSCSSLGASCAQLTRAQVAEFAAIGALAGLIAEAGASGMGYVLAVMSGESSGTGTVILSWADAQMAGQASGGKGYNVVIHEFAHQLDMLNGDANGFARV